MKVLFAGLILFGHMVLCYAHNRDPVVLTGYLMVLSGELAMLKGELVNKKTKQDKPVV